MKVLAIFGTVALSQITEDYNFETTTVDPVRLSPTILELIMLQYPHDPVAMEFCASGCVGTDYEDPAGHCFDGFYPYPDECSKVQS